VTEIFATLAEVLHIDFLLKIVLGMIMLSVGLSLQLKDFVYVLKNRRLLAFGLSLKILLIPLLAWGIVALSGLSPLWQFGIMLMLFCPGGTTSNVITYWAGGTSALTIFLTVLSGFITLVTLPLFTRAIAPFYFSEGTELHLPIGRIIWSIVSIILLPALTGLLVRRYYDGFAQKLEELLKKTSTVLLGIVYLIKFFAPPTIEGSSAISWADVTMLMPVLLIINIGGMLLAYFITRKRDVSARDGMTIGIEMGVQNGGLAILIGDVLLSNHDISKPALIYAMFSFWTTAAFAWWGRRKLRANN
jgi:BASS family bile acid:Na+ symporter